MKAMERPQKIVKWIRTKTFITYLIQFAFRICVFLGFLIAYLIDKNRLYALMNQPVRLGITPIHVLWLIFMVLMIEHIFPRETVSMAMQKARIPIPASWAKKKAGDEKAVYQELELLRFVQDMNQKAWMVLLVWLCFNAVIGFLYLFNMIGDVELLMITVFVFLSDYICILVFCPFQTFIILKFSCRTILPEETRPSSDRK